MMMQIIIRCHSYLPGGPAAACHGDSVKVVTESPEYRRRRPAVGPGPGLGRRRGAGLSGGGTLPHGM